ncbi:unnamed protein product [Ectocarpus sp. 12 AP-2014]
MYICHRGHHVHRKTEIPAMHGFVRATPIPPPLASGCGRNFPDCRVHQAAHRVKHVEGEEEDDMPATNLSKLVCLKSQGEKVIGFHFVGPNAGEITQGFGLAVRLGAKKSDFNKLVGIHPSDAESFCAMDITRSSGVSYVAEGGCGGGVCG